MERNERATLGKILTVVGKQKIFIAILLLVQVVLGISSVFYTLLLRNVIDNAVSGNLRVFLLWITGFVVLILFQIGLRALNRYIEEYASASYENSLKKKLFYELLKKDYASVNHTHSAEWMNRLTSDTQIVSEGMASILPGISGMAARLLGAVIMLLVIEFRFVFILVPGGLLMVLFTYIFRKKMKERHREVQEADGTLRTFLQERLSSLMIIKAFRKEELSASSSEAFLQKHQEARIHRVKFSNLCNSGFSLAINGAYVLGVIYCGFRLIRGNITYGTVSAILALISQIQNPFANISGFLPKYYAMLASAERLFETENFEDDLPSLALFPGDVSTYYRDSFHGISIRNIRFSYPEADENEDLRKVLEGFSLEIQKGASYALTGTSGGGKSSLLKLLLSMYKPDSGNLLVVDENGEHPLSPGHRPLFAYVPQGNLLMAGSIRNIVSFGDEKSPESEEKIRKSLAIACADGFVSELEKGLDTELSEKGSGLSEGQMQRIAIARALYSEAPILLLDEATSALDKETERQFLMNLKALSDRTLLIVTHRPAALEICSHVVEITPVD